MKNKADREDFEVFWRRVYKHKGVDFLKDFALVCYRAGVEAAEQKMHPTLLEERKIDVYCPHCSQKFGIALPASQSG